MAGGPVIPVVTDSFACLSSFPGADAGRVTVVPNRIAIGGTTYRESVEISAEEGLRQIGGQRTAPALSAPTTQDFLAAYARLAHGADGIISLHASRELSGSWANARQAAAQFTQIPIAVIDTRTLSGGQTLLARLALSLAGSGLSFEAVAVQVRSAVERTYSIYFVDNTDYLLQNRVMEPSHAILSSMIGVKPLLACENGHLVAIEKVKTRAQAVERMVEFAIEFTDIADALIVHGRHSQGDASRMLHDRLTQEFPERVFPTAAYSTSLAAIIGADATGLVVIEHEMDDENGLQED
jgi:DegV family protein with EDD domain